MRFLDTLTKTLSGGVDRARFEADKFQRSSSISGEINNIVSQVDTNLRQLGERALELHRQGMINAPEITSLAQIIDQLREQQEAKERELEQVQNETLEAWQARQPQPTEEAAQAPADTASSDPANLPTYQAQSEGTQLTGTPPAVGAAPYACPKCGYTLPPNAAFCPNCGARVSESQS